MMCPSSAKMAMVLLFVLLSLTTSKAQIGEFGDISENNTQVVEQANTNCDMTCPQITQLVQEEGTKQFDKHFDVIGSIANYAIKNNTRAHGKCKEKETWGYYDSDMDRCRICSGNCATEDLICVVYCQGYVTAEHCSNKIDLLKSEIKKITENHKVETDSLQSAHDQLFNAFVVLFALLALTLIVVVICFVWKFNQLEKKLSQQKASHPKGDVENATPNEPTSSSCSLLT